MIKIAFAILICLTLTSCSVVKGIQENEGLNKVGSFQLNPVQPNDYWYNGKSYEYNDYKIQITSQPYQAKIKWNGKTIVL